MSAFSGSNGVDPELLRVRRESRSCQTCGGEGQVIVFHPKWSGKRVADLFHGEVDEAGKFVHEPTAMEVAAHCVCALGRWMRERTDSEIRQFIPDVNLIFDGTSSWLLEAPEKPVVAPKLNPPPRGAASRPGASEAA